MRSLVTGSGNRCEPPRGSRHAAAAARVTRRAAAGTSRAAPDRSGRRRPAPVAHPELRGDINNGDVKTDINGGVFSLVGSEAGIVSLWDKDDFDPDDHLGDWHISPSEANKGERPAEFRGDGSHYQLTYEVRPDNW
ncbi:hypothetical protein [Streptomyces sp. NPDC005485]|uniref:hypothetical protein n=1 Tax=Streptomyces sp. NPDC005485 TaxID=3155591 RepID=UPI0033A7E554